MPRLVPCTYIVLLSLPADGSCHILIDVDAESCESCIERDSRPSGEEQPVDFGKLGLVMLHVGAQIFLLATVVFRKTYIIVC